MKKILNEANIVTSLTFTTLGDGCIETTEKITQCQVKETGRMTP